MYTWEIQRLIKESNGVLTQEQYMKMCNTSPQIEAIYVDPDDYTKFNRFEVKCNDADVPIKFQVVSEI